MKFSDSYNISFNTTERCFDPVLTLDTPLFIDPFLIYSQEFGPFVGSHLEIIKYFQTIFEMIAKSGGQKSSPHFQAAMRALYLPEVPDFCLGYSAGGVAGAGSRQEIARDIAEGIWEAIKAGAVEIDHFEEVAIIRKNIGPDRISDAAANLLRVRFAAYTKEICNKYGVPLKSFNVLNARFDQSLLRWVPATLDLPENPANRLPVLLSPRQFLRNLPTINADDFWSYCYDNHQEVVAQEFGQDVSRRVDKETIINFARSHVGLREEYVQSVENSSPNPYDFTRDTKGLVSWYEPTKQFAQDNPLQFRIHNPASFAQAVAEMVKQYKHFVESNKGYKLLWNDNFSPKPEEAAQLLFLGVVKFYCAQNNIEISREAEVGRGPVDFKVSQGHMLRTLLEIKKANNSRFWNGLYSQLPAYMQAAEVTLGWYVVILLKESDKKRLKGIEETLKKTKEKTGYDIRVVQVDAIPEKLSASKLKPN